MNLFTALFAVLLCSGWAVAGASKTENAASADALTKISRLVDSYPLLAGMNSDEALVEELRAGVLLPWERAWLQRDSSGFESLAEGQALTLDWDRAKRKLLREKDGVREFAWDLGRRRGKGPQAQDYLSRFQKVEAFTLEAVKVEPGENRAALDVRYDLRGQTLTGTRRHDRGQLRLELARRDGGAWKVVSIRPAVALESLEADEVAFEEATAAWGLDRLVVYDRKEAIRRGGYAVVLSDFDGDGRPDLLVGGWGPMRLLKNTGAGFVDVTDAAGLRGETLVKSAAFVDLDNDGLRDLILLRFVEDGDKNEDFVAYRNIGNGRFERAGGALTRSHKYDRAMPLTVADFDSNGTLDLYLGFPGTKDFTTLGEGPQSLATQGVWLNDGRWNFREMGLKSGIFDKNTVYPHSAVASDLDRDGRPDLIVMNDRAGISPIYRNLGEGKFEDVSAQAGIINESWAMTAAVADYDGDGFMDIAITNIDFLAGQRILASRKGRESGPEEKEALSRMAGNLVGNRLFRNRGDGTFEETTDKAGIRWAGEASSGVEWIDYNADGLPDLFISNGLWSGGERDISSLFMRLHANRMAPEVADIVHNALNSPLAQGVPSLEGPNPLLDILRSDASLSMAGDQRNRLFRNNGDGTFTEVGFLAGVDSAEDGYVVSLGDVDQDGHLDMILRNGDPSPGRDYPAVQFLRNKGKGGRSLMVYLEGSTSNRDGLGAVLTMWTDSRKLTREVRGVAGAAQSEPMAHFGLGQAKGADRLEVLWPSGLKETYKDLPAGRILLREGAGYRTLAFR